MAKAAKMAALRFMVPWCGFDVVGSVPHGIQGSASRSDELTVAMGFSPWWTHAESRVAPRRCRFLG